MAKENIGYLKTQEEVNALMAKLWFNRKNGKKNNEDNFFIVGTAPPAITEIKEEEEEYYNRKVSLAVSIMEQGHPVSWASGLTRIPEHIILKSYEDIKNKKIKERKLKRRESFRQFLKNPLGILKIKKLKNKLW